MLTILLICIINYYRKELNISGGKIMDKNNEKTFKLDATLLTQTRNLLIAFMAVMGLTVAGAGVAEGVNEVKTTKEANKGFYKTDKLSKNDKKDLAKDLAKDAFICIVGIAVMGTAINALRASKRYNDQAAARVARRYLIELRKSKPELKKYDYILNNEMALHNIAAGIANILPMSTTIGMGSYWDIVRHRLENTENKTAELKQRNFGIEQVIKDLKDAADNDSQFMDKLVALVESSAKTFSLEKYMSNQKTR